MSSANVTRCEHAEEHFLISGMAGARAGDDVAGERALTKRQRRRLKAEEEERVRAAELRQLQQLPPESEVDFERLVSQLASLDWETAECQ